MKSVLNSKKIERSLYGAQSCKGVCLSCRKPSLGKQFVFELKKISHVVKIRWNCREIRSKCVEAGKKIQALFMSEFLVDANFWIVWGFLLAKVWRERDYSDSVVNHKALHEPRTKFHPPVSIFSRPWLLEDDLFHQWWFSVTSYLVRHWGPQPQVRIKRL